MSTQELGVHQVSYKQSHAQLWINFGKPKIQISITIHKVGNYYLRTFN